MQAFRVAYDGHAYHGFQRQPDVSTVSDAILTALRELSVIGADAIPPGYAAAGRTDAGVSAIAQTVAFAAPEWLDPAAFNSALPADIRVWAHAEAPSDFHATHDADRRIYEYYLFCPTCVTDRLDAAVSRLTGTHDVTNLTPDQSGTVRTLTVEYHIEDPYFDIRFEADGFPRQFVRRAVTLLRSVSTGDRPLSFLDRVLAPEPLSGPNGIAPASPLPLLLVDVVYPMLSFEPAADTDPAITFQDRARTLHTRARVTDRIVARLSEL